MVAVCETGLEFTASTPGPRDSTASATDFEDAHCTPDTSITVVAAVPAMSIPPIGSTERLSWGAGRVQLTESTAAGTAGAGNPPARAGAGVTDTARNRRNRRLLDTTNTDENAIAAPAINGLSNPAMASGSAATLYAKRPEQVPPDRAQGTAGQP